MNTKTLDYAHVGMGVSSPIQISRHSASKPGLSNDEGPVDHFQGGGRNSEDV